MSTAVSGLHPTQRCDYLIIGGGMAGASAAYWLAPYGRVVLLEREAQPGHHSTGRSAALFMESYGSAQVRALTMASRAFFENPPPGFTETPLLRPRGAMMVASPGQEALLQTLMTELREVDPTAQALTADEACARVSVLVRERVIGATYDAGACDMDVHAIHHGFLRGLRAQGGEVLCNAEVSRLTRSGGRWQVQAGGQTLEAPVVLNAAGAWADEVAHRAGLAGIGLQPCRRSAMLFAPPGDVPFADWPLVVGASEDWYILPSAGQLLGSPANADPVPAHDVQPEALDIAMAIDRIEDMTTLRIRRPSHTWAGLRSFVADHGLVGGFDVEAPGFFWVAAQGGYGIQTAAAMGEACAALARGLPLPDHIARFGLTAEMLSPARLR